MGACLHHVETMVRDQFFFMDFTSKCNEKGWEQKKNYPAIYSPVHGKHNGSSVPQSVYKLQSFL